MPILGVIASSRLVAPPVGDFESIATTTVGSTPISTITFSSIPQTYKHLQIRGICKSAETANTEQAIYVNFNSDTGANYSRHGMYGTGSALTAYGTGFTATFGISGASSTSNAAQVGMFGVSIMDILDYTSGTKLKTTRAIWGTEYNSSVGVLLSGSFAWNDSSAITSIRLQIVGAGPNFVEHSSFALYGIKGA
jgi:hypothetical protein